MKRFGLSMITLSASLFGEGNPILVDIQAVNPNIQIDLKYATADNFTGQVIYAFTQCLLLEPVAKALSEVQQELKPLGLGLKVWDGYRPIAAQWKFWEILPDPRYVSDPRKGGRHTRGTAVDVTLVNAEGQELVMPTAFDDFSERAHSDYTEASAEAIRNRDLLRNVMGKHGFTVLPTEWWHFDFKGWQDQPVLEQQIVALPIATPRLVLRDFVPSDIPEMVAIVSHPEFPGYRRFRPEHISQDVHSYVEEAIAAQKTGQRDLFRLAITLKEDPAHVIGCCVFDGWNRLPEDNDQVGYFIHPHYQGQGYTTEAVSHLLAVYFLHYPERAVEAIAHPANIGSQRVLEKLGFSKLAEKTIDTPSGLEPRYVYSLKRRL